MNEDTLQGSGRGFLGKVKETAGEVTGDSLLKRKGIVDQLSGQAQKVVGSVKEVAAMRVWRWITSNSSLARSRSPRWPPSASLGLLC